MSKTKFTKGNWYVSNVTVNGDHVPCSYGVACDGFVIASDVTSGATFGVIDEIQRANAALMAASPDMYDALASIQNDGNQVPAWLWDKIQDTLAKARGEK